MSEKSKDAGFQAAPWYSSRSAKLPGLSPGVGSYGAEFKTIVPSGGVPAQPLRFESPYVSPRKLQEINEADRRQHHPPEPDAEALKLAAYKEGFAKGEADGFAAGKQQAKPILDQLQRVLSDIDGLWRRMVSEHERQLMDLVCRVAEKIVLGHVEMDHETVKRVILDAFAIVPEPVGVTIEVNPSDYEYIDTIKEDFFECIHSLKEVSVSADPSVARGGCKIHTRAGEVDATLPTRLEAVRKCVCEANERKRKR